MENKIEIDLSEFKEKVGRMISAIKDAYGFNGCIENEECMMFIDTNKPLITAKPDKKTFILEFIGVDTNKLNLERVSEELQLIKNQIKINLES